MGRMTTRITGGMITFGWDRPEREFFGQIHVEGNNGPVPDAYSNAPQEDDLLDELAEGLAGLKLAPLEPLKRELLSLALRMDKEGCPAQDIIDTMIELEEERAS